MSITIIDNFVSDSDMTSPYRLYFQTADDLTLFNNFVAECQYNTLLDLMGAEVYNDFASGLQEDPIPQKWLDLRDGAAFQSCRYNLDRNYRGMTYTLTPLIYAKWITRNQQFATITGTVVFDNENARQPNQRELAQYHNIAYNEFVDRYNLAYDFLLSGDYENTSCMVHRKLIKKGLMTKNTIR